MLCLIRSLRNWEAGRCFEERKEGGRLCKGGGWFINIVGVLRADYEGGPYERPVPPLRGGGKVNPSTL